MNIFILSRNPKTAAISQVDSHVVKMPLETAQLLCTAVRFLVPESEWPELLYKPTHAKHPCSLWARECSGNFNWLKAHGIELCREYTHRFLRRHKCQDIIESMPSLQASRLTPFAQAMPEQFRSTNAVLAYRKYYLLGKMNTLPLVRFTRRQPPDWLHSERIVIMPGYCGTCIFEKLGDSVMENDFSGITTLEDTANGMYAPVNCSGCGHILVDHAGFRISWLSEETVNDQMADET